MNAASFDSRIEALDITLFSHIPSQTTDADKRSLLAVQACARGRADGYVYLEIGSHLGGSIQTHLQDPRCKKIYSIDKRPALQPDDRGPTYEYPDNSTERMIRLLTAMDPQGVSRIECFDQDACSIPHSRIPLPPDLCFVDGEHTASAVFADFDFCLKVCARGATIVFHDAPIVFRGLRSIVSSLKTRKREFSSHALSDAIYVICLDSSMVRTGLTRFAVQGRRDDLWSPRNDLRLLKWRALSVKERASNLATKLLGRS